MLGKALPSPMPSLDSETCFCFSSTYLATVAPIMNLNLSNGFPPHVVRGTWVPVIPYRKWELHSTTQTQNLAPSDEDGKTWEACRQALSAFQFGDEEQGKILGKAFGRIHSPYWGEERKKEVPTFDGVNEILNYLRSLSLSDDDLQTMLKKFPEVLGCKLETELMTNVQILEKEWGIKGKSLRNLLLRNPKVLGYNVDCKGDCMAQCTRCWVRF